MAAREVGFFPKFAPLHLQRSEVSSLATSWKQVAVHRPFLFHAELVCGLSWVIQTIGDSDSWLASRLEATQTQQRGFALELLRREFDDPSVKGSNALIHAIGGLAVLSELPRASSEPHPPSLFGDLQCLHAISRFKVIMAHQEALKRCVAMTGGISGMRMPVLVEVLQILDLRISTTLGQTTRFPAAASQNTKRKPTDQHSPGFPVIQGISPDLQEIISQMSDLIRLLDIYHHHHQRPSQRSAALTKALPLRWSPASSFAPALAIHIPIATQPRFDHHTTITVPDDSTPNLEELLHLAARIYSDMVLFPLTWVSGVKHQLARRMYAVLHQSGLYDELAGPPAAAAATAVSTAADLVEVQEQIAAAAAAAAAAADEGEMHASPPADANLHLHPHQHRHQHVWVWIPWFGCFAAIRSEIQPWFEARLVGMLEAVYWDVVSGHGVRRGEGVVSGAVEFEEVRDVLLLAFLWWGPLFDGPGRALWGRIAGRVRGEGEEG